MQRLSWLLPLLLLWFSTPLLTQAQPASTPNEATHDLAADAPQRELQWSPCPENVTLECATLTLPVDYTNTKSATFEMAVIRAKASNPNKRLGVFFTHPGGHASGVTFLAASVGTPAFQRIRERFDIVMVAIRVVARACASEGVQMRGKGGLEGLW